VLRPVALQADNASDHMATALYYTLIYRETKKEGKAISLLA
jgi:hypothetical protein